MEHDFSRIPKINMARSKFKRSHGYKTTFDAGYLVPIFRNEVLPGDGMSLSVKGFGRLNTPIHTIMDNLHIDTFFFFVPNRLIWTNWKKFNGAQDDPGDSTDFTVPTMTATAGTGYLNGTLSDYFGIPTEVPGLEHVSLYHRAYNLIWNQWFRDENLQDSVVVDTDDGPDTESDYVLKKRGKRHDYFTSSLPWPQKSTTVQMALGTDAPITGLGADRTTSWVTGPISAYETDGTDTTSYTTYKQIDTGTGKYLVEEDPNNAGYSNIRADLSAATGATINELRESIQVQEMYEGDARGGTRYTEIVNSHFGVTSPDSRLQRAEYLGGGHSFISMAAVAQTSSTDGTSPQGNLAAFGTVGIDGHGFSKDFTEHGVIIGLACVRADLTYQQGLDRALSRSTRWDYFWPGLQHLGEQAVLNKEIYADASANDDLVFGYQERYAEYRYKPSLVTGQFRSNYSASLDTWHLSQEFGTLPVLDDTFIQETPPIDRVVAITTKPNLLLDVWFDYTCARPMAMYSVPGLSGVRL